MVHFLPYLFCDLLANKGKKRRLQTKRDENENSKQENTKYVIFSIAKIGGNTGCGCAVL